LRWKMFTSSVAKVLLPQNTKSSPTPQPLNP
jgi:hypothetical protein